MYPTLVVPKNSNFFITLSKTTDSVHSYVSVGVEIGDKKVLLAAFGKVIGKEGSTCGFFFWDTNARIMNERLFYSLEGKKYFSEMDYKAYSINYAQYLQFLEYMSSISKKQKKESPLEGYCPVESGEDELSLNWGSIENIATSDKNMIDEEENQNHLRIGKSNTCRHSALDIIRKTNHMGNLGEGASSFFLTTPPLKTSLVGGVMGADGKHVYILPLPPESFTAISTEKRDIITKLYKRLDLLIMNKPYNELTTRKFEKIKGLYLTLTLNETTSLAELFKEINHWVNDNKTLISAHRKSHWISFPTATEKMFNKILESLPKGTAIVDSEQLSPLLLNNPNSR